MNKRGLTLVETVAATTILVIATVSILAAFVMLKASGVNMRHHLQAINLISARIEKLKSESESGGYANIGSISNQQLTIDDNVTVFYSQTAPETEDAAHVNAYKTITATLEWQEGSYAGVRNVSESFVTIITK